MISCTILRKYSRCQITPRLSFSLLIKRKKKKIHYLPFFLSLSLSYIAFIFGIYAKDINHHKIAAFKRITPLVTPFIINFFDIKISRHKNIFNIFTFNWIAFFAAIYYLENIFKQKLFNLIIFYISNNLDKCNNLHRTLISREHLCLNRKSIGRIFRYL